MFQRWSAGRPSVARYLLISSTQICSAVVAVEPLEPLEEVAPELDELDDELAPDDDAPDEPPEDDELRGPPLEDVEPLDWPDDEPSSDVSP